MANLSSRPLAFLDTETTGLSPWFGDRICEIAILRCQGDTLLDSFETLVNPQRPLSPGAARVNGLSVLDLADAPLFAEIAPQVRLWLEDAIVVCHNAPFDLSFISTEFNRLGQNFPTVQVIDTLVLARTHFNFGSNGLQAIAGALGIQRPGAHRALADVCTTRAVLEHFLLKLKHLPLEQLVSIYTPPPPEPVVLNLPLLLEQALACKQRLFIHYVDQRGNQTRRWITPKQVLAQKDYFYVVAHCHLRDEDRSFRLDRIVEMKLEDV
jgi:DNA polymerase-3 subunit epsilon